VVTPRTQAQAPARSLDQRMEALKRANDIRVRRAQLKKDLKDGRIQIEEVLRDPPEYVETAKVFDMLMAVPKFGRVKATRLLNQCRISQSKTVGGLSERQRTELVALFNR
jgi:S13-like H2TH domain